MKRRLTALSVLATVSCMATAQTESEFGADLLPGLQTNVVRAQLVPLRKSLFSAGISAIVQGVAVQEGDTVEKGDLLLAFDCDRFNAAFNTAQARVKGAEAKLEVNRELVKLNSVGPLEVKLNEADLEAARGELEAVRAQLKHCEIRAPFDGAVTSRVVEQYQFVEEGEDLLELVSRDQLEVRMLMPSTSLSWLQMGTRFTMLVEELDLAMPGEIVRVGGAVDPVSLTIPVFGRLADSPPALLPGMSGAVQFAETEID
ncbi:MAG: efflux RND transporter periplasmic adaptor subunit [Halieaceae bacterium]|nr:efflux RND transporter periplasmic adaptor subunit [Halieaceae bacterium]